MTPHDVRSRARAHAVPIAMIAALAVVSLLFRSHLLAWFSGGTAAPPSRSAATSHAGGHGGAPAAAAAPVATYEFSAPARAELRRALANYDQLRRKLAADDAGDLAGSAEALANALRAVETADQHLPSAVAPRLREGAAAADAVGRASDLAAARTGFAALSEQLVAVVAADAELYQGVHLFECPMTKGYNKWLQPEPELANPYQGAAMLTCGAPVALADQLAAASAPPPAHDADEIAHYTCPMDTWVKQKHPGQCPVCGMDLVSVTHDEVRTGVMRIDHRRRQLIGLKTGLVERRDLTLDVRAVGRVAYDETRLAEVNLKYGGWIDKLLVDQTGQRVRKGQPLLTIYSPELYSAQQDYLLALAQRAAARDDAERARTEPLVRGARQRLKLWDVSDAQLEAIANKGEPLQHLPVLAPASGYVVAKDVVEGAAVKSGQRLFRIAALDRVWVEADVYEQDIPLVQVGQEALVTLSHLPGRTFSGRISFIYPYLDGGSRTARARVELKNADLELKPEMYASVQLRVPLGKRLVIPEAAVIYSGPRRIVFVDMNQDQLRPQPIEVGVKVAGYFEVLSGVKEGQRVVTSGNFLLSAESRPKAATGLW
jgi:membrane fusion protein, copper/silver efflux system